MIFEARSVQTSAIKRGQKFEDKAKEVAEEKLGVKFSKCGLFISDEYPVIAGSPDSISRDKDLIEITNKNKYKFKCFVQKYIKLIFVLRAVILNRVKQ